MREVRRRETQRAKDIIEDLKVSNKFDVVPVKDEADMAKNIEDKRIIRRTSHKENSSLYFSRALT